MIVVDVGNTFTRIVGFSDGKAVVRKSYHSDDVDLDELTDAFRKINAGLHDEVAWFASVKPPVNALVGAAAERAGLQYRFIRSNTDAIMSHSLSTPETTGVDRLLAAYSAGVRHFPGAADGNGYVVIQCGSAVTIDLVDGDGVFCGGYILPGPTFWMRGLSVGAQLPDLSSEFPDWADVSVGDNTRDAMMHGMQLALPMAVASAAVFATTEKNKGTKSGNRPVIVTGGWGEAILPWLPGEPVFDSELLLHGIRLFAEKAEFSL